MRIGEATKIQWTDIDTERSTITVNNPEKNSNARIFKVSHKLISILYKLPRKGKTVFNTNSNGLRSTFQKTRRRLSFKLQNPRLMQIHFHTFRHWKATMEYHKTRDPYHVKQLLGHKKLQNTEIYINIEHAIFSNENDDFHSATAKNVEDARQLIEVGFEFVCTYNDTMLFRKRK